MIGVQPPEYSLKTKAMLTFARKSFEVIVKNSADETSDDSRLLAFALFDSVVIQHFHAIIILSENRLTPASVSALFRPFIEAALRGHWLRQCATDKEVEEFFTSPTYKFPGFQMLAKQVGEKTGYQEYFQPFIDFYSYFCDHTHTGIGQISRQFSQKQGVGPHNNDEWAIRFLRESIKFAIFHAVLSCKYRGDINGFTALGVWAETIPAE